MISVALCTFNGERFLDEQLGSITLQTRPPGELVVCDDGSIDRTIDILNKFKSEAPFPVTIHRNQDNLGSTKNFQKTIGLCSGDIIALCDQDDVWKSNKLEVLEDALLANPEKGYAFSDAELVDEQLKPLNDRLWDTVGFVGEFRERFFLGEQLRCFLEKRFVTGATMAFRANVGQKAMPIPGNWIHDGWIAMVSSATGSPGIPVTEPLIYYRQHSAQQIGTSCSWKDKNNSLISMYRGLKRQKQELFADWEMQCLRLLELKSIMQKLMNNEAPPVMVDNLALLKSFETHYINRRTILTSRGLGRYGLILQEMFSGRYGQFSNSWRSLFRDLFL